MARIRTPNKPAPKRHANTSAAVLAEFISRICCSRGFPRDLNAGSSSCKWIRSSCENHNSRCMRAFTRAQQLRQSASQQQGNDHKNDYDLDEREDFLNVVTA